MLTQTAKQLVAQANAEVTPITPEMAAKRIGEPGVVFIDLREPPEIASTGSVTGALRVPRGVLEFQADPDSPSHRPELSSGRSLILFCGSGARSALAAKTLRDMGIRDVAHVPGGFAALKAAGAAVVDS